MNSLQIFQIILSGILIVIILLQNQGQSLMGGEASYVERRGLQKILFYTTIAVGVLFLANSVLLLVM